MVPKVPVIDSKRGDNVNAKTSMAMVALGVGGTLLYQNVKNGYMKKWVRNMNKAKTKAIEDLEDMM